MVKFINKLTGCMMFVDESRKDEYIALGHELAPADIQKKTTRRKQPVKKDK